MYIVMHGSDNPKMICCQGFWANKLSGEKRSQKSTKYQSWSYPDQFKSAQRTKLSYLWVWKKAPPTSTDLES